MLNTMLKARNKKGFTLMEMLIVVAIIAILIAIAIPAFASQLDKAREGVDKANLRSAKSEAVSTYLLSDPESSSAVTYHIYTDANGNLKATSGDVPAGGVTAIGESKTVGTTALNVVVTSGEITSTTWDGFNLS